MKLCKHGKPVGKICRCYTPCGHSSISDCERRLAAARTMEGMAATDRQRFDIHLAASGCAVNLANSMGIDNAILLVPEQWD